MKRVVALLGAALLLLLAVLVANTLRPLAEVPRATVRAVEPAPAFDADAAVQRLAQALRFPTVSFGEPERLDAAAFAGFRSFLRESYPRVFATLQWEEVNTHSLLGRWPGTAGAGKPAMFLAHYDVVPVDPADAGKWTAEPFGGEIREGFVWGRGALDDKVNLISILEAIDALLAAGWAPGRDLYFGFGHDEEVGGEQGAARIAELLAARGIALEWMVDEGGAISLPGMVQGVDRPVAVVGIAEKGYLSLELLARAAGGHSSVPRKDSSILALARALDALDRDPFPQSLEYLQWMAGALAPELDFLPRLVVRNLWLFGPLLAPFLEELPEIHAMTRVTQAPTMLAAGVKDNVQPTEARAVVNFRLLPGWTIERVRARVAQIVAAQGVEVRVLKANEASPAPSSMSGPGWQALDASIQAAWREAGDAGAGAENSALTVVPFLVMGGTDLKRYASIAGDQYRFGFVPMTKADFRRVHGIDERVPVAGYLDNIRFYSHLLRNAGTTP
jgi:carboxypeptidase PM20D1